MSSEVEIIYDPSGSNLDITSNVMFEDATFEAQMNAVPGTGSFRVKDPARTYSFVTGREIQLWVDGTQVWGGYIRRVNRTFPFMADDTSSPSTYENRVWHIEAVDYNILLDSMIIRNTASYTTHVPNSTGYDKGTMDGWALWKMLYSYTDFPQKSAFGITSNRNDATFIDDVTTVLPSTSSLRFKYNQQGTPIRVQFEERAKMAGAVFYISGDKKIHYHAYEAVEKRWGFSDNPNYNAITTDPASYQGADWGFHGVTGEEDGSLITNDVLIYGGSPIGSNGSVIYCRLEDATSQADHGRWQLSETHFNEPGFGVQSGVDGRADVILRGPPGAAGNGLLKGLRYSQWSFQFEWWADKVPTLGGYPNHILAGDIVRVELEAFGVSQYAPCRTLRITFPELDSDGKAYTLFSGEFSFSYTDPIALWRGLLGAKTGEVGVLIATVGDSSASAQYGDFGSFTPEPAPDGLTALFDLPADFGYIANTLVVSINGLTQRRGMDYMETDPLLGEFTLTSIPIASDTLEATCRMLPKT